MPKTGRSTSRKTQILESLAQMLEQSPGGRITTASLAAHVGVTEAALYRHFPSKAKMFEGLIAYIEDSIFLPITEMLEQETDAMQRCSGILRILLEFSEKNPGICRILNGDALAGETDRLRKRIQALFSRLETQIKQVLREAELRQQLRAALPMPILAGMALGMAEGRISQFVRSDFKRPPTEGWAEQWAFVSKNLLVPAPVFES